MKNIFIGILIIVAFVGFFKWTAHMDEVRNVAYQKYEECVKEQYGTTPSAWYYEHGETPECISQ